MAFQDNVFVTLVASIQYRAMPERAADAFYKLSNTKEQIQAYVFDGMVGNFFFFFKCLCGKIEAQDYLELVVLLYRPKWGSVISLHVFIEMVVNFCFSVLVACIAQKSFLQSH